MVCQGSVNGLFWRECQKPYQAFINFEGIRLFLWWACFNKLDRTWPHICKVLIPIKPHTYALSGLHSLGAEPSESPGLTLPENTDTMPALIIVMQWPSQKLYHHWESHIHCIWRYRKPVRTIYRICCTLGQCEDKLHHPWVHKLFWNISNWSLVLSTKEAFRELPASMKSM